MNVKRSAMRRKARKPWEMMGLVGAGVLFGLPLFAQSSLAQAETVSNSKQSPPYSAPGINPPGEEESPPYEAPEGITFPVPDPQLSPNRPPLPENRSEPVASIMPMNGQVSIRLVNNMNADAHFELVGYTDQRTLAAGESTIVRNIPLPVTIAAWREDRGYLEMMPVSSMQRTGMFQVGLDEDRNPLDDNQGVLRIQQNGQVFLN